MRKAFSLLKDGQWECLLAVLLVILAMGYAVSKPIWDWDAIAYQGLSAHLGGADWTAAHRSAYALVDSLADGVKQPLYSLEPFRKTVAADPESLRQVSGFYADRMGFYVLLWGFQVSGMPPAGSFVAVGLLSMVIVSATMWAWGGRLWGRRYALLGLTTTLAFPSLMKIYRLSNPDGLVAAFMLLGGYLWLYSRGSYAMLAWLSMVLLRPNTTIWLAPLGLALLVQALRGRGGWTPVIEMAGLGAIALGLHTWAGGYGLAVLLRHTFEAPYPYPAMVTVAWDWGWYADLLSRRLLGLGGRDFLLFYGMLAASAWMMWRGRGDAKNLGLSLTAGALMMVLLFPGFWERHYAGLVLTILLCAATATGSRHPHAR